MDFSSPKIMGIVNVTPDSFSDGTLEQVTSYHSVMSSWSKDKLRVTSLIQKGAEIIDIGGESTGPDSKDVSLEEEMERVKPVVDWVGTQNFASLPIFSIDTYKADVADYALSHGFAIVNDVTALRGDLGMIEVLMKHQPYVILMYSKDSTPRTTREDVQYDDVIGAIRGFLAVRIDKLLHAGFPRDRILIDPGMGMFVSADPKYSFEIVDRLDELKALGYPICVGPSRKSFLGGELKNRDARSWEVARQAIQNGASIVRMHTIMR
ncbi:dihydropteroate synthase [Candidatus Peregrinibacteria bacterium]|nr:dihydropteroate synthase [Candidatus Peregrinibacteria bacterium]